MEIQNCAALYLSTYMINLLFAPSTVRVPLQYVQYAQCVQYVQYAHYVQYAQYVHYVHYVRMYLVTVLVPSFLSASNSRSLLESNKMKPTSDNLRHQTRE